MKYADFHCHILPGVDDGAKDINMSLRMIQTLSIEKVSTVFATPHYYCYMESESSFVQRRAAAAQQVCSRLYEASSTAQNNLPEIRLGAEIRLIRDMPEFQDIGQFVLEGTDMALLELPYEKYDMRMGENIHNMSVKYHIRPIIAHVERYLDIFKDHDYEDLFSIPDAVFQVSVNFIEHKKAASFTAALIKAGMPLLFGSDCHNLSSRPPIMASALIHFDKFCIKYKIKESEVKELRDFQMSFI